MNRDLTVSYEFAKGNHNWYWDFRRLAADANVGLLASALLRQIKQSINIGFPALCIKQIEVWTKWQVTPTDKTVPNNVDTCAPNKTSY